MEGPIVYNEFNSKMRATALADHKCVSKIEKKKIIVYRDKIFTITSRINVAKVHFDLNSRSTLDLKEMLDFIVYHTKIANENHTFTKDEMDIHMQAITMIEIEIQQRADYEIIVSNFILKRLIKEKEIELELLQKQIV